MSYFTQGGETTLRSIEAKEESAGVVTYIIAKQRVSVLATSASPWVQFNTGPGDLSFATTACECRLL